MSTWDLSKLRENYQQSESVDQELFAEQRSNILLIASEHYAKKGSKFYNRIADAKGLTSEQKLRITKNHIYKIMRSYSNAISSFCPSVACVPQDKTSLEDQKQAELHEKVKNYMKEKYRMREKTRDFSDDFTGIGEVGCLVKFDPTLGKPVGYEQEVDPAGNPVFEEDGVTPKPSEKLMYSGDFILERLFGFNTLRDPDAKSWDESPLIHIRKMVAVKKMQGKYAGDPEKLKAFKTTPDGTFMVFDASSASYGRSKDQCMVVETYLRPCMEYPEGYFYFWTEHGIFEEGELPFGIWPISFQPFDKFQTSPRGRSHIKVLRPFQAELNRMASKVAEHQVTQGDDKIIMQAGSKVQQGGALPGIRGVTVSGAAPQILPGRAGDQFLPHITAAIQEMYKASLVEEEYQEKENQMDAYAMLSRAASQKKKFSVYTERFEQFQIDLWTIMFELARHYMPDDELEEALGADNAQYAYLFRDPGKLRYKIAIEPQSDDIETKLGRTLLITQALQYVGPQLDKEDLGVLLKQMPYGNTEEMFSGLTQNQDIGTNLILSLDKGKVQPPKKYVDADYILKRLEARTLKPDFERLAPQIQAGYAQTIGAYQQVKAEQVAQIKAMKSDMIPTTGPLITCEVYVPDPKNPGASSKRMKLPNDTLMWAYNLVQQQGTLLAPLESTSADNLTEVLSAAGIGAQPQQQASQGMAIPAGFPIQG